MERFPSQVQSIEQKVSLATSRPVVAFIEWMNPLTPAGNKFHALTEMAGGTNLLWKSWEDIVKGNPDIILIAPSGFEIDQTRENIAILTSKSEWYELSAVQNNRVFILNGKEFFQQQSAKMSDALEILADVIHPELFDFGTKMTGWQYA